MLAAGIIVSLLPFANELLQEPSALILNDQKVRIPRGKPGLDSAVDDLVFGHVVLISYD